MLDIFRNPRYRGKHVVLAAGKIYTAKTGEGAAEILKELEVKQPNVTPEVAYIPKARTLIFYKKLLEVKVGNLQRNVPIAFFDSNEVPPLLGRLGFLETFDVEFLKTHRVVFKN